MDSRLPDGSFPMKIGGQQYDASMFSDRDYGDLDNYVKAAFIAQAVNAAKLIEDSQEKLDIKKVALKEATFIGWDTPERIGIMSTPEGVIQLGFQLIRKRHPLVSFQQFAKQVLNDIPNSFEQINIADQMLNYQHLYKDSEGVAGGAPTGSEKS